ncbi:beta-galactosidase [Streptomyces sp. NPDC052682]|uniref:glycoside hydrolase family 35 protein n=1 Tax=Streptomyces sp. NPDC052682 TaxID=3154954 RepID=UPI00342EE96E
MELSRRTFSALAGTAALGLALTGSGGTPTSAGTSRTVPTGPPPPVPHADGARHQVRFDRYSLLVDGRRLVLWPGETHPFRLPSPSLWRDVLQKLRAHGFNAVRVSVAWNYHSPAPGAYDFTGVRDLGLFLRMAAATGLYVVLRPGPFVGADVDGGGLPGWLAATQCRPRTADPAYLRHAGQWLSAVNAVAARHLFTRGRGTVLLYQLDDADDVLPHLRRRVRADGIDVPLVDRGLLRVDDGLPDPWGGQGYARVRQVRDAAYERRARLADLAEGGTPRTLPMAFGGTSWGWLPAPDVYTSYDYGAALDEARRQTPKLAALHELGHLLRSVPDFARLERAAGGRAADRRITVRRLANPDTGARVHVLRNDSAEAVSTTLPDAGVDVPVTVPARDATLLVTRLALGQRRLAYSTVPPMLSLRAGRQDIAVFTGRAGQMAQVVLDCEEQPVTTRLDREPAWSYADGRLTVTSPLGPGGLNRVLVEGGDSETPMLLLFGDDATAVRLWPCETPSGALLVYGPALLRSLTVRGSTVHLTGDTIPETGLEVWGPPGLTAVTWNGRPVPTRISATGSLLALRMLPGVPPVTLPALDGWRRRAENPESEPGFDDSGWPVADRRSSYSTTPVPDGQPVLFADDYGFHYGDVWYRGAFTGARELTSVSLAYRTGTQGLLMAWLDGQPLGTHRMPVPDGGTAGKGTWTATAAFAIPERLREDRDEEPRRHVLSVLVRPMQRDGAEVKAARGLSSVRFEGADPEVRWRVQGARAADPVRGPLNHGGLYGEREGWHLPGYDDGDWEPAALPRADRRQGVTWYRTGFRLSVPGDVDASVGLVLDDDPRRAYRAQIFLNGWNLGQYVNDVGPQHTFVLPNGILRTRGENTLALAVLSDGTTPAGPGTVRLTLLGSAAGGVPVEPVDSPGR